MSAIEDVRDHPDQQVHPMDPQEEPGHGQEHVERGYDI
jgi:hypothetical protein